MQQELVNEKRKIIEIFLKKGVLISSELLSQITDYEHASRIFNELSTKQMEDILVISADTNKLINNTKQQNKINVVYSYKENQKKRVPQDFVDYFNNRYKGIERILKHRQELRSTISISKITNKKEKEAISIIGMVSDKQITKNGNLLLLLEDPTGQRRVLVNKNKPALFNEARDIVLDEVIGVVGVNVDTLIFANSILWPDIPTNKDLKKSEQEKYALFLSDLHVGSSKFLPDDFEKFLKWINGEMGNEQQRHIAKDVKYIFIAGDLVDGCGIYPEQDKELIIKDIYDQYKECANLLKQIPSGITLIICPGNHDAIRLAEPQPPLHKDFAKPLYDLNNIVMVSNPALININSSENFMGFDVLIYHGYSFDYFVAEVN